MVAHSLSTIAVASPSTTTLQSNSGSPQPILTPPTTSSFLSLQYADILDHPNYQAFQSGGASFCVIPSVCQEILPLRDVLEDSSILKACGMGGLSGIASSGNQLAQDIRRNVHQTWIRSAGSITPAPVLVGNLPARNALIRFVECLQSTLDGNGRSLPPHLLELSYLSYEPGAFYKRHVDVIAAGSASAPAAERDHHRCVSFLLYLGDPTDTRSWDAEQDGGCLRIYFPGASGDVVDDEPTISTVPQHNCFTDIPPEPGTLVIFDSKIVPHEVLMTNRFRSCVVGWFGTEHCDG